MSQRLWSTLEKIGRMLYIFLIFQLCRGQDGCLGTSFYLTILVIKERFDLIWFFKRYTLGLVDIVGPGCTLHFNFSLFQSLYMDFFAGITVAMTLIPQVHIVLWWIIIFWAAIYIYILYISVLIFVGDILCPVSKCTTHQWFIYINSIWGGVCFLRNEYALRIGTCGFGFHIDRTAGDTVRYHTGHPRCRGFHRRSSTSGGGAIHSIIHLQHGGSRPLRISSRNGKKHWQWWV